MELFHFLRPWWLLFVPLWLLLSYGVWTNRQQQNGWSALCDPALLTYLVGDVQTQHAASKSWLIAIMLAGSLAIVALAGPVLKQLPQPVIQAQSAMIIVLDLSRSMDAEDVKPSRLIRAKQKIHDILAARKEGQTGLIVFAGSAFDVVPLTSDNQAILSLLSALDTSMMPAQGSLASQALQRAAAMFQRGAIHAGSVVMLCDGVDQDALSVARELAEKGHRVSVLATGTLDGAPIPMPADTAAGGFMKDDRGNIILPGLNAERLSAVAAAGNGLFQYIRLDDADVLRLPGLIPEPLAKQDSKQSAQDISITTDQWHEEGPWLLLLVLPLCALAFRRGVLLLLLIVPMFTPAPAHAMTWDDWWQTPDQQGQALMAQGVVTQEQAKDAADLFDDPQWKAAAHYRAGQFEAAAKALADSADTESLYNKGNALARAGDLQAALDAYDAALEQHEKEQKQLENNKLETSATHQDAKFNRNLVEQAMKQQQDQKQDEKSDKQDKKKDGDSSSDEQGEPSQDKSDQSEKPESDQQSSQDNDTSGADEKGSDHGQDKNNKDNDPNAEKETEAKQSEQTDDGNEQTTQARQSDQQTMEEQQAAEQWLRRIPDDPGGLLRRKFKYQYQQREQESGSTQAW